MSEDCKKLNELEAKLFNTDLSEEVHREAYQEITAILTASWREEVKRLDECFKSSQETGLRTLEKMGEHEARCKKLQAAIEQEVQCRTCVAMKSGPKFECPGEADGELPCAAYEKSEVALPFIAKALKEES